MHWDAMSLRASPVVRCRPPRSSRAPHNGDARFSSRLRLTAAADSACALLQPLRGALAFLTLLTFAFSAAAGDADNPLVPGYQFIQKFIQTREPVSFGPLPTDWLAWGFAAPSLADPPLSTDEHVRDGVTLDREQCGALTSAVWQRLR